jgi:hypothetical protein
MNNVGKTEWTHIRHFQNLARAKLGKPSLVQVFYIGIKAILQFGL